MSRPDTNNFESLFLRNAPLLDTRAPVEFARGAFPQSINLPLMDDDQRQQVGVCYKERGQDAAIALGHRLVSDGVKEERVSAWRNFAEEHPEGYLYCFRGGLRSATVQQWLREAGLDYPLVLGGYKAMRNYLLEVLEACCKDAHFILIAGATGCGKTRVIEQLSRACDLEGLACHRGSAFGHLIVEQPTQISFENALAVALMQLLNGKSGPVFLEDEGKLIGRLSLPAVLRARMQGAPMLVIEEPLASRVNIVVEDYVIDLGERYTKVFGTEGALRHQQRLQSDIQRISKRLGGERTARVRGALDEAFWSHDARLHRAWITMLLEEYYDPMYRYQIDRRQGEIVFRGDREAVLYQAQTMGGASCKR